MLNCSDELLSRLQWVDLLEVWLVRVRESQDYQPSKRETLDQHLEDWCCSDWRVAVLMIVIISPTLLKIGCYLVTDWWSQPISPLQLILHQTLRDQDYESCWIWSSWGITGNCLMIFSSCWSWCVSTDEDCLQHHRNIYRNKSTSVISETVKIDNKQTCRWEVLDTSLSSSNKRKPSTRFLDTELQLMMRCLTCLLQV